MPKKAFVEVAGKQVLVEEGKAVTVPYFSHSEEYKKLNVLSVFDENQIQFGAPYLSDINVEYSVEKEFKGRKILAFKFKKRKGYKKKIGHRPKFLVIKVNKIGG